MSSRAEQLEDVYARMPALVCKGKCQASCGPIVMSQLEAARIKAVRPDFVTRDMEMRLPSGESVGVGKISECLTCPLLTSDGNDKFLKVEPTLHQIHVCASKHQEACEHCRAIAQLIEDSLGFPRL